MSAWRRFTAGLLVAAIPTAAVPAGRCPSLELVFAVDVSNSVSRSEFRLQTGGIAAAFRDPHVKSAIIEAGGIGVAVVFWADPAYSVDTIGRVEIKTAADAERFARQIERARRYLTGNTGLGSGLWAALDVIHDHDACGQRKVVDISGDGRESNHRPITGTRTMAPITPSAARSRAERSGITVNALAILNDDPHLAEYYAESILAGPGAFVLVAADYDDFATAMKIKLLREIAPTVGSLQSAPPVPTSGIPAVLGSSDRRVPTATIGAQK